MRRNLIFVEDGETVIVIAKTPGPTVYDPCDLHPYVSQAYRVVADRTSPTLALLPLTTRPVRVSNDEVNVMMVKPLQGSGFVKETPALPLSISHPTWENTE